MDFTIVPSSLTTKVNVDFDLNIPHWQSMVEDYEMDRDESVIEKHFEIDIGDGSIYHGWFVMNKGSNDENLLYFSMNDVQELSLDVKLLDSDEIPIELELKDKLTGAICETHWTQYHYQMDDGIISFIYCFKKQTKSLKGHLTASFEPSKEKLLKEKIDKNYSSLFEEDGNEQDFKIISGKNEIRFNKSVLMKISPVFQADIERWEGSRQNNFEIPEEVASSATIFAFQDILRQLTLSDCHRITPGKNFLALGLYKFTHVYQIHPLHKIFGEYVGATLTSENLLEVAEVAFPAPGFDNKELLARVAEFLKKGNKGLMKEHLATLKERNYSGYIKVLELYFEKN